MTYDALRTALRSVLEPVVVVTGRGATGPAGLTVSSFASVSAGPPLVLFCPGRSSRSWAELATAGRFAVNVLGRDQADVALSFAGPGDRFADVAWTAHPDGPPVLTDSLAVLLCRLHARWPGGDHEVVLGLVEDTRLLRDGTGLDSHTVREARLPVG